MSDFEVENIDISEAENKMEVAKSDDAKAEEERAKKTMNEINSANEHYMQKLKSLNEKKAEVATLQSETLEALQRATALNDQFNMVVNRQLLTERDKLQNEVKKLKTLVSKNLKPTK
jgi:plasmid rolling circle replication initiator protein Rep